MLSDSIGLLEIVKAYREQGFDVTCNVGIFEIGKIKKLIVLKERF